MWLTILKTADPNRRGRVRVVTSADPTASILEPWADTSESDTWVPPVTGGPFQTASALGALPALVTRLQERSATAQSRCARFTGPPPDTIGSEHWPRLFANTSPRRVCTRSVQRGRRMTRWRRSRTCPSSRACTGGSCYRAAVALAVRAVSAASTRASKSAGTVQFDLAPSANGMATVMLKYQYGRPLLSGSTW